MTVPNPINNKEINALNNRSGITKLQQILTFVDKKNAKKVISIAGLIAVMKQALEKKLYHAAYFSNKKILAFLNVLKEKGFIFNYHIVPPIFFKCFLVFGYKPIFHKQVVFIYFRKSPQFGEGLVNIKLISRPSREVYITYQELVNLNKHNFASIIYFLNTTKGVLSHIEAINYKIGGKLICAVK